MEQIQTTQEKTANDFIKAGDILYTSWGYEQTNREFFKVIKILGKRYFLIQEIGQKEVEESQGFMCANVVPTDKRISEPIKAYCDKYGYMQVSEKGYKRSLYLWDGKAKYKSWYG